MADLRPELKEKTARILSEMTEMERIVVGLSGGVDSSTVAALAHRALGADALAATAVSETLPEREFWEAREVADEIGIRHRLLEFSELADDQFRSNTASRCYFCQSMRFGRLHEIAEHLGFDVVASGTNHSDRGDHRPGLEAMREQGVYQPLLEHEIEKDDVRRIARGLGLSVWDKPAKACLSSRIPHGLEVTQERLRRIEAAEEVLYEKGFRQFRVRDHDGLARIEVEPAEMDRLLETDLLAALADGVREAGFQEVTVDLGGYRSGSLNPTSSSDAHE